MLFVDVMFVISRLYTALHSVVVVMLIFDTFCQATFINHVFGMLLPQSQTFFSKFIVSSDLCKNAVSRRSSLC